MRRISKGISVGGVRIGGGAPVTVQSMTKTATSDVDSTVRQINALKEAGCEIIRVAVPDMDSACAIGRIKRQISIPLIADIHFDHRLAIKSIDEGADGLRLNPGNIGSRQRVREVVKAAKERGIPIRIGVNSGSLEKDLVKGHGHPVAEALVESALRHIGVLEEADFDLIKVSLKASSVPETIKAYRLLAEKVKYPFHIGITEAGTSFSGTVKSAVGIGALLAEGIGDTLRVSLTGDPLEEVRVGWEILRALELRKRGVNIISCPTCGRIKLDCVRIAGEVEERLKHVTEPLTIAIMGCVVNGPGEASRADIGIAGGDGVALIYSKGSVLRKVKEHEITDALCEEVRRMISAKGSGKDKLKTVC
jgi:(E)-4-hydroxy-3-methylbut-2-enyl-diphosphate synthase